MMHHRTSVLVYDDASSYSETRYSDKLCDCDTIRADTDIQINNALQQFIGNNSLCALVRQVPFRGQEAGSV